MTDSPRSIGRLPVAAALLAVLVLGSGRSALAQQIDDDEEEAPVQPAMGRGFNAFVMNDAQFDQWVFGNMGVPNPGTARNKLDSLLTLQVDDLERTCGLSPIQKKKLLLAGRGDIKRFFDRIEDLRKKFTKSKNDQNVFNQLWQEVQPLRNSFTTGFFDKESIFAKSIKATLTPEQTTRHEEVIHDRVLYRYWAKVDLAMELLNNEVGFTDGQRLRLVGLLKEETKPPRKMGDNEYYVVLYQLSRIPESKIKPVFEDFQWPFVKRQLDQGRAMGMFLKQNGFVGDEGPETRVNDAPRPQMKKAAVPFE